MDFDKLNSMTKYPEIKTYHKIAGKGILQEELTTELNPDQMYHVSEKVDGTNIRTVIIVQSGFSVDYFIGSRDDLLTAKGDRIFNPQYEGILDILSKCQELEEAFMMLNTGVYTVYFELYGGNLESTKQYSYNKNWDFRVFDVNYLTFNEYNRLSQFPKAQIASWRDHGGQGFYDTDDRIRFCKDFGLRSVPFRQNSYGREIPIDIKETYEFLASYRKSNAGIDFEGGRSEGIVIRSDDRKQIVKLRFEDYERTLGIKRK